MRKLLIIIFVASCAISNAQDKYSHYRNSYIGKTFDLKIEGDSENYNLHIDADSWEKIDTKGGFIFNKKEMPDIISTMNDVKLKFSEWIETAKINKVQEVSKQIQGTFYCQGYWWVNSYTYELDNKVKPQFDFYVKNGKPVLIMTSEELNAFDNEYINTDGVYIAFSSVKEMDDFILLLSHEKIVDYIKKPKQADLFKN